MFNAVSYVFPDVGLPVRMGKTPIRREFLRRINREGQTEFRAHPIDIRPQAKDR